MNFLRAIRFVASLAAMCSVSFLVIDFLVIWIGSVPRDSTLYWICQLSFQLFLAALLASGVIVIYTGPSDIPPSRRQTKHVRKHSTRCGHLPSCTRKAMSH